MPLSDDEIDDLARDPSDGFDECAELCRDLLAAIDRLEGAEGAERRLLIVRIRALQDRRKGLHCRPCLPE